jgi:arabinofuranan 3-O-arabinosyltransferase
VPLRFPCGAALPRPGEDEGGIDRLVDIEDGGDYEVAAVVRQRPVGAAGRLLDAPGAVIRASASSVLVGDPRNRPQAAVDSDPSTAWIAAVGDTRPTLTLDLPTSRTITGLVLRTEPDVGASRPFLITVRAGGRTIDTAVDEDGAVELPSLVGDRVSVEFRGGTPLRSIDLSRGITTVLPIGVSEVVVRGALDLGAGVPRTSITGVECGFGPAVSVDGNIAVQTRVVTTVGTLLTGERAGATSCGGTVRLAPGTHRIQVLSTPELSVVSVRLSPVGASDSSVRARSATVETWDPTERVVRVPAASSVRTLELAENANAGWTATLDGAALEPMVVDGWRQAFVLPAGAGGEVALTYAPDRLYRAGLIGGAAAVLALLVLAAWPPRRGRDGVVLPASRRGTSVLSVPSAVVAAVILAVLVAGALAPIPLVAAFVASRLERRPAVVAALAGLAAVVAALAPWPGSIDRPWFGGAASLLALTAVVLVAWPRRRSGPDASAKA